ncbi:MAG: YozE family protein [Methylococcales bacterium]
MFALLPKKPKPRTGRFSLWLKQQTGRDDPIGDLAGDMEADGTYPQASDSIKVLRTHLVQKHACPEALQALAEAWDEFKSNNRNRSGISIKVRFEVFRSDGYRCRICSASASVQDGIRLEVDHEVPVSKGGSDELENLWTLCFKCNRGKGASDL